MKKMTLDFKMGSKCNYAADWTRDRAVRPMVLNWLFATRLTSLAIGLAVSTVHAQQGEAALICTNPASGVSWQIKIDYDRSTVDSYPARIGDATISWHDAKDGGNYTLDRKSGNLTVIVASSTGGSFLYDRCRPEN